MPKCPNEPSDNIYKTTHKMLPTRSLPNGLIYECQVCHATITIIGGR
jgi:hypothetical protein